MGSEASEQVLALLSELSVLTELNRKYEAQPNVSDESDYRVRQQRHEEITRQIKALADKKKNADSVTPPGTKTAETPESQQITSEQQ
jgi:hypothetical protein